MVRINLKLGLFAAIAGFTASQSLANPAPAPPPFEREYQPQGVDEVGIWRQDDESERALAASPLVIRDERLTAYVKNLLCDTVGSDRCSSVRVYIMREPTFNATMSPNGTMRVLSGLFLRVRSEAELAAILGHEFGHFEKRHSLLKFKSQRKGTDLLAWGALLASMAPSYDARQTYQNLEVSVYGNLFRYSRDQEREADLLGLGYLNESRLPPQSASAVWRNIMNETEASAKAKGIKEPNFHSVAFTASHPPHGERAEYLNALAASKGIDREDGAQRYREALAEWIPLFLEDQIKLNDFGASDYIIGNLAKSGWTAELWFARGELYRTRGSQRDLVNAIEFYSQAIGSKAGFSLAYRGLGLSLLKTGRPSEGKTALRKYLELSPDAPDGKMIRLLAPEGSGQ